MKTLCVIFVFIAATSALMLNCEFRVVRWLAFGENYQCHSEAFYVQSTPYVTSASGVHLPDKTAEDVVSIHIDNCTNLEYVPLGLLNVFPNLRGIYLEGCGVKSLYGDELNEYPQLTLFALELSPLDYVPGNLFARTPGMVLISFADNKIERVGSNLLKNLNDLSQVYFENNVCTNINAPTAEEIPGLISELESECSDPNETTHSTSETTSSTSEMPNSSSVSFTSIVLILVLSGFVLLVSMN